MGDKGKGKSPGLTTALILADSFNERFLPLTLETPRALLPLANVPMIDYTIEFLVSSGMTKIFVYCRTHADQIEAHLSSRWGPETGVEPITSPGCSSAGEALRDVFRRQLINTHFLLVSGDLVANVKLEAAFRAHMERFKQDNRNVMTMVFTSAHHTMPTRASEEDTLVAFDPDSNHLIHFDNSPKSKKMVVSVDSFDKVEAIQMRYDLLDCYMDICAPSVLQLFVAEFDFNDLRTDFVVKTLKKSELQEMQNSIHLHISDEYAVRVRDFPTYAAVSMDVIHRWSFPLVLDTNWNGTTTYRHHGKLLYMEEDIVLSRSCDIREQSVIGGGSCVGDGSRICASVLGRGCKIGKNVQISGCFLWEGVVVQDGAVLTNCLLSQNVKVLEGTKLGSGVIVGRDIIIGPEDNIQPNSRITSQSSSMSKPLELSYSEEEEEERESFIRIGGENSKKFLFLSKGFSPCLVKEEGEKGEEFVSLEEEDVDAVDEEVEEETLSNAQLFVQEVRDTLIRGIQENVEVSQTVFEIKSLRMSYDTTFMDSVSVVFPLLFEGVKNVRGPILRVLKKWKELLKLFASDVDDQMDIIFQLQDFCTQQEKFRKCLCHMLHGLYELDILEEEAILNWADEVAGDAEEEEGEILQALLKQCESFLDWLRNASEDEDDD